MDAPTSGYYLHAAARPGIVTLDERGTLSRTAGGRTDEIAAPCEALTDLDEIDDELTLICDRDRVVLWHGRKRRTWVAREGSWKKVAGGGPPRGTGLFCSTPAGLFYVDEEDRPFLLDDSDRWELLPSLGDDIELLFCRPGSPALWAVTSEGLAVWRGGAFRSVTPLPEEAGADARVRDVWYDPAGDRVLLRRNGGMWQLPVPDVRGGFPTVHAPAGEPAPEPWESRSCYVLEASIGPGGLRQGLVFALPYLESVRDIVEELVLDDSAEAESQRDLLARGGMLTLWVVQEGLLTGGVDLKPHLDPAGRAIDWDAVAAATPALRGELDGRGRGAGRDGRVRSRIHLPGGRRAAGARPQRPRRRRPAVDLPVSPAAGQAPSVPASRSRACNRSISARRSAAADSATALTSSASSAASGRSPKIPAGVRPASRASRSAFESGSTMCRSSSVIAHPRWT
ncbi:hypothetical protein [Nonomuraea sp. NPDC049695]|uniref:hypothetical protein n=1 Tax=Nonomuraea sp. NPDC049695 TaxID=3154734 RepID=UPI00343A5172